MWLEPYKDKYRAIERYIDPITGKTKRVSIIIEKDTKAQRKAAESVLQAKIDKASSVRDYDNMTLQDLADKYKAWQEKTIKASSFGQTKMYVRNILNILGPDAIVSNLTAAYVSSLLVEKSPSPGVTNKNIYFFKAMIRWGYDHDFVNDKTWLDKIKTVKEPLPSSSIEGHYLEQKELRTLLKAIQQKHWKLLTEFLVLSGLRISEAIALTVDDVDSFIHVNKTYWINQYTVSSSAKTDSSHRDVFIQPRLAGVIRKIRAYRNDVQMKTGVRNNIFFPAPSGDYILYEAYEKVLISESTSVLGRKVTPHMLRHTHASLLAEQGMPLEAISRRLGHSDSRITKEIYLHVTQKQRKEEEEMLKRIKIL